MTAQALIASCEKRGISLFVRENGKLGYKGPQEAVTPKLLQTLVTFQQSIRAELHDPHAELRIMGQSVEDHLWAFWDKALVDAKQAAEANQMPTADALEPNHVDGFNGIVLRPGHFVWDPNKWLVDALNRAQVLRDKYGAAWLDDDTKRPGAERGAQALMEDIETVVYWWYEWQLTHPKPEAA